MIPNSSFCSLCCMVSAVVWFGMHFHIHVYCLESALCMLRLGYLFWCILFVMSYSHWSPVWPAYELLHVLYFNLYMPLEFILFGGILLWNWLYMVLLVQTSIFKSLYLNKLVTLCMSWMWYVKVTHFFFCCVCVGVTFFFVF
jgi:hypothetical protein